MDYIINGLRLPAPLVEAIETHRWKTPANEESRRTLFPHTAIPMPKLYSLNLMQMVNETWRGESRDVYIGKPDSAFPSGNIDPSKSLLIAELGPDLMIALDYRGSLSQPSVVYLTPEEGPAQWVTVAPDIQTFIASLGLRKE